MHNLLNFYQSQFHPRILFKNSFPVPLQSKLQRLHGVAIGSVWLALVTSVPVTQVCSLVSSVLKRFLQERAWRRQLSHIHRNKCIAAIVVALMLTYHVICSRWQSGRAV